MTPELDRAASIEDGLLERGGDLRQLGGALADAGAGTGRLVVVEGPAGIGKSRLLAAACERAGAAQMRVLTARGTELERSYPFGVVRQSIDRMARESNPDDQRRWLSGAARLALPVVDPSAIEAADAGEPTFPRLQGLYWLLVNLAGDRRRRCAVGGRGIADVHGLPRPACARVAGGIAPRLSCGLGCRRPGVAGA